MSLTSAQGPKEPDPPTQLKGLKQVRYWMKQNLTQQTHVTKPTDNIMLSEIYVDRACSFRLEIYADRAYPSVFSPHFSSIRLAFSLPLTTLSASHSLLFLCRLVCNNSLNATVCLTLSSILSINSFCHSFPLTTHLTSSRQRCQQ